MQSLALNKELFFTVEKTGNKLRLIVLDTTGAEVVCHKVTPHQLNTFMADDEGHLFMGRLQLHKHGKEVTVDTKGEAVGVITTEQLLEITK